jgi:HNH endonuclease
MFIPGEVVSYLEMCREEGVNLQRGMNFRLRGQKSVVLMSVRKGAPYADRIEEEGRVLVYEGHDVPTDRPGLDPKAVDQPLVTPGGKPTQNGLFMRAVDDYKAGRSAAEYVHVYEKIRTGIWVYNGLFQLVDAWIEDTGARKACKFRLELAKQQEPAAVPPESEDLAHTRLIPTKVKLAVWKRDKGRCVECGSSDNLHFDHIVPYSRGGSSLVAENIQLLCARHNLAKSSHIA